jgi:predicted dehydrogenase
MDNPIRVLLAGAGNMGRSHGKAYHELPGFELCGIVTRGDSGRRLAATLGGIDHFTDFDVALASTNPDAVGIASFTETHVPFATAALEAGCHVFVEKPLAAEMPEAEGLVALAQQAGRALVVGYILRHHPSWQAFVARAKQLGKPLVMRMNLNQQSDGAAWTTHRSILATTSPLVDCGVHYVDVMNQMTGAQPVRVHAIGARLAEDVAGDMFNYGQLQVTFEDGSVGWYEAGWGPMMSETAFFVKDVIGPRGSVSIESGLEGAGGSSADVDNHTVTNSIRHHHADVDPNGMLSRPDDIVHFDDEPGHDELCRREQEWFLRAIHGEVDVAQHLGEVLNSMRIVLAADESIRTRRVIDLG